RGRLLAKGMNDVFRVRVPFPDLGENGALSVLVSWTRNLSELVQQLTETAIATGLAFSLKELLSQSDWEEFAGGSPVSMELKAPKALESARWCLMRGARIEILGKISKSTLGLYLEVPSTTYEPTEVRVFTNDIMPNDFHGNTGRINSRSLQNR